MEALQLHSNTQSHWSSGSTVGFLHRRATIRSWGCTHAYNETRLPASDVSLHYQFWQQKILNPLRPPLLGKLCKTCDTVPLTTIMKTLQQTPTCFVNVNSLFHT